MTAGTGRRWMHRGMVALQVVVALVASGTILTCGYLLWTFLFDPAGAEEWTVGLRPSQFYADIDIDQKVFTDAVYGSVFGVAHNSGGSIEAVIEALISGADIIEVDVAEVDGDLYAAHSPPLPIIGDRWFRGPSLARVWAASYGAEAIMLDLKESSQQFISLVGDFLATRSPYRQVIVSSREVSVLRAVGERAPGAILLLSVPDAKTLDTLLMDETALDAIDGVTIRHTLLDVDTVTALQGHHLLVFAWTVNALPRVNELIGYGVDSITTDNLGIQALLSGNERGEHALEPVNPMSPPP
ncbi:MAG TPA: glycerophosphodiester phosphodiesterase [Thermomicrobiales bacterium]|nr:glycerophosphodiester phosphodiesterase [Thermomicrobiales bacterium]